LKKLLEIDFYFEVKNDFFKNLKQYNKNFKSEFLVKKIDFFLQNK